MITSLRLVNFKSFADATLNLGPFTVIVGANASGKSNIRDAFRFLHGIGRGYTLPEIVGGKFGPGGQTEWAPIRGAITEIIRFRHDSMGFEVSLRLANRRAAYSISIRRADSVRGGFQIEREKLKVGSRMIFTSHPGFGDPVDRQDDDAHLLLRMEKTGSQRKYGERLAVRLDQPALSQIVEHKNVGREHKELVKGVIDRLNHIRFLDLVPDLMRKPTFPGQTVLGDSGDNLPALLQEICDNEVKKGVLVDWVRELTPMDVKDIEFPIDSITGFVQLAFREADGSVVSAYSASDGTLRFLAMIAALLGGSSPTTFFFEEIDTGIHPSRLRLLLDFIERQAGKEKVQAITTTHAPDLLSMIGDDTFENASVVTRLPGQTAATIRRIKSLPNAEELRRTQGLGRLHTSGWLEDAVMLTSDSADEPDGPAGDADP